MAPMLRQDKQDRPIKDAARRVPSPLTSKSFLLVGAAFLGAGGLWFSTPEKGSTASWLSTYAPATMTLAGSYLGGFLIGWGARPNMVMLTGRDPMLRWSARAGATA